MHARPEPYVDVLSYRITPAPGRSVVRFRPSSSSVVPPGVAARLAAKGLPERRPEQSLRLARHGRRGPVVGVGVDPERERHRRMSEHI